MKKYKDFEIVVLGEAWQIKYVGTLIKSEQEICGLCDNESKIIWICSNQNHKEIVVTIFHELFHAFVRRSGIYNGMLSFDMEEIICDQFGTIIAENFDFKL